MRGQCARRQQIAPRIPLANNNKQSFRKFQWVGAFVSESEFAHQLERDHSMPRSGRSLHDAGTGRFRQEEEVVAGLDFKRTPEKAFDPEGARQAPRFEDPESRRRREKRSVRKTQGAGATGVPRL